MESGDQLRVSSGATFAPGCINPDSGRQVWQLMAARMRSEMSPAESSSPPQPAPDPDDYALPPDLERTTLGQLYRFLLASADASDECPTNAALNTALGYDRMSSQSVACLRALEARGHIKMPGWTRKFHTIEIVATGQVLRNQAARLEAGL